MANVSLLEKSLTQLIDPAEPTIRTFSEKRESAFTLLWPEIPGRKLSPRPRYSRRARVNLNMHANSILFTTSIWQAQRRRPIVTNDTDIFSTSKRHLASAPHISQTGISPSFLQQTIPPRARKQIVVQHRVKLLPHEH